MERTWRLAATVSAMQLDDGWVLVRGSRALRVHGARAAALKPALDGLARGAGLAQLEASIGPGAAAALLRELLELGWLAADEAPAASGIAARQLGYLELFGDAPAVQQRRLEDAVVGIVGVGGVGGMALQQLVACGVRRYVLVDHDTVALDNLNRQLLYAPSDIGRPKVHSAAGYVRERVRDARVSAVQTRVACVADLHDVPAVDVVVVAADAPRDIADVVWSWARRRGVPMTAAAVGLEQGWWGPLLRPAAGECWWCFERARRAALNPLERALDGCPLGPTPFSFGPSNGVVAALLAHDVVQYLASGDAPTAGCRSHLDLATMATTRFGGGVCSCAEVGAR